jgi:hypothetical protein
MFREAGKKVPLVTMSCPSLRTAALLYLPLDIKHSLKEDVRLFALGFWPFDVGGFEGKRIAEGKVMEEDC